MKSALARFDPSSATNPVERRRQQRHRLGHPAILRTSDGSETDIKLRDLSHSGCNIEGTDDNLRPGSFVSIGLGPEDFIGAIVRWVRADRAGMEFLREIAPDRTAWTELMDDAG